jgi:hypothetical protein
MRGFLQERAGKELGTVETNNERFARVGTVGFRHQHDSGLVGLDQ